MTKLQNKWTCANRVFQVCLLLIMAVPAFAQQIVLEEEVSMLALGDSYTIGEQVEEQERWPHQFAAALRKEGVKVGEPDYVATTGWTTSDLLEGMSGSLSHEKQYNLVSILIGVNNQYQGLDVDLYEPELREIIEQALAIAGGLRSRVFMLSIPDYAYTPFGEGDPGISREIDAYNAIKERVAREYGISFIDITPISRQALSEPDLVAGDGLHPSGAQYGAWIKKLLTEVKIPSKDDMADFREIKAIFFQQEKDWNQGDINAFMEAYWKSDELQFGGASGITKGWNETLASYKAGYPDRASMGQLSFHIKDLTRQSKDVVSLTGSWELIRENDRPGGHFLLIWKKLHGEWKIVADHTSQYCQ